MRRLKASSSRAPATVTLGGSAPSVPLAFGAGQKALVESAEHAREEIADRARRALRDELLHRFRACRRSLRARICGPAAGRGRPASGARPIRGVPGAPGATSRAGVSQTTESGPLRTMPRQPNASVSRSSSLLLGRAVGKQPVEAHSGLGQRLARGPDLGAEERGDLARRDPHVARRAVISRDDLPSRSGTAATARGRSNRGHECRRSSAALTPAAMIAFIGSSQSGVCPSASSGAPGATRSSSRDISRSDAASPVCLVSFPARPWFSHHDDTTARQ